MKIKTTFQNNCMHVSLAGELDHASAPAAKIELDEMIEENHPLAMIVNLKQLTFMDSTGVGLMMGRYRKLKSLNAKTYIEEPTPAVDKVFRVSGLYQIIEKIEKR